MKLFSTILKPLEKPVSRMMLKISAKNPEILLIGGGLLIIAGTVKACSSTLEVHDILDAAKEEKELVKETYNTSGGLYHEDAMKRDLARIAFKTGKDLVRLYTPAAVLETAGLFMIFASYGIMKKRNLALVAAYNTLDGIFKKYRQRVREDIGEEKDKEYRYGLKRRDIDIREVDEEGTEIIKPSNELVIDNPVDEHSDYAKWFDERSRCWKNNSEYNLMFLKAQQNYANELLHSRGHVFLNEIYDMLDIPRTPAGAVVGWVEGFGDGFIDFGIYDGYRESQDFVNGYERDILLDFNVDGVIYDKI